MHIVKAQINDDLYNDIISKGIDIQAQFNEYLFTLSDDGYPSISKKEATQRVSQAIEDYRNGTMKTVPYNQGMDEIDNWLANQ
ncbi:MAG: hypothetical protein GQ570_02565 [Helicobacteraceae bacterium]|nr:hypothetical protein [Helicobacteraceae bacterium]